jgi:hypothetical protein
MVAPLPADPKVANAAAAAAKELPPDPKSQPASQPNQQPRAGALTVQPNRAMQLETRLAEADVAIARARADFKLEKPGLTPTPAPQDRSAQHSWRVALAQRTYDELKAMTGNPNALARAEQLRTELIANGRSTGLNYGFTANGTPANSNLHLDADSKTLQQQYAREFKETRDTQGLVRRIDTNQDNVLSRTELEAASRNSTYTEQERNAAGGLLRAWTERDTLRSTPALTSEQLTPALRSALFLPQSTVNLQNDLGHRVQALAGIDGNLADVSRSDLTAAEAKFIADKESGKLKGSDLANQWQFLTTASNFLDDSRQETVTSAALMQNVLQRSTQEEASGINAVGSAELASKLDNQLNDSNDGYVSARDVLGRIRAFDTPPGERWLLSRLYEERFSGQNPQMLKESQVKTLIETIKQNAVRP